jgi:signal transduction histidine kinase
MSLRNKLILLFMGLAVVPLLILAAFSNWQAQKLLRDTAEVRLQEEARDLSTALVEARFEVERELHELAGTFGRGEVPLQDLAGESAPLPRGSILDQAAFLGFRPESGQMSFLGGAVPTDPVRCLGGFGSRVLEVSVDAVIENIPGTLSAGYWASDLLVERSQGFIHRVHLIDPGKEEVLFSNECQTLPSGISPGLTELLASDERLREEWGVFSSRDGGKAEFGAFANVHGTGLVLVTTSPPDVVISSLNRMVLAYWIFVLGLGLTVSIAFSMLLSKFTKSLQALARAAEEIGTGELDPWLPLPTAGEVGQLTLAFSRMLERIRLMMAKVDQSGRLAVVGQLSAYLAHEIRNPLSSIKLNLQRLQRWTKNGSLPAFCLEPLEISLKEVDRLSASVTGVLELSSAPDTPLEVVSLHAIVGEAADLIAARFRRQKVSLTLDLDADADRVLARVGQIKSVILNLMVNALEAQPDGGNLQIRSQLSKGPDPGGPVVGLHFKDEGCGILPEIRDRVFEPFFTTKSSGSGIGLAMASQAVQDCNGTLYLEPSFSQESGAEFVMVLPLAAMEAHVGSKTGRGSESPTRSLSRSLVRSRADGEVGRAGPGVPAHLMSPEGLETVLSRRTRDPEGVD